MMIQPHPRTFDEQVFHLWLWSRSRELIDQESARLRAEGVVTRIVGEHLHGEPGFLLYVRVKESAKMDDPILATIATQICGPGCAVGLALRPRSTKPICTATQKESLERCIVKVKARNVAAGCKPEGTGSRKCPSAFAVCSTSLRCRPGRAGEK